MYIAPNTTVHILRGVPLNNRYTDSYDIAGGSGAQITAFLAAKKYTFSNQSYVRVGDGKIRLDINPENLYDCNYMIFQNTKFGNKWFYAFITGVEYANNQTAFVSFEIDVLQTWINDISYNRCFIERQHSLSDEMFENTLPESITDSSMVEVRQEKIDLTPEVWVWTTSQSDGSTGGSYYPVIAGINNTLFFFAFPYGSLEFQSFVQGFVEKGITDNIVWCCMGYREFRSSAQVSTSFGAEKIEKAYSGNLSSLNGYVPRNNKLFCYPYNYITASNQNGGLQEYRYEYFADANNIQFNLYAACSPTPSAVFTPHNYRTSVQNSDNFDYNLPLNGFPGVAVSGDSFKQYVARNSGTLAAQAGGVLGAAGMIAAGVATGGLSTVAMVGLGLTALGKAQSLIGELQDAKAAPEPSRGTQGGDVIFSAKMKTILIKSVCVRAEYAAIIDDYFDLYGYAFDKIDFPSHNHRPEWDYVKTNGACNGGNIPADDLSKINDIFDNGIRFWHKWGTIGNYSLSNKP